MDTMELEARAKRHHLHQPKERHDTLKLCALAIEQLKAAGFIRVAVSMKSEATYWKLPGRHGVLRVSAHRYKQRTIGLDDIVARLTFNGRDHAGDPVLVCSTGKIDTMIAIAVGQYVLRSATAPDRQQETP